MRRFRGASRHDGVFGHVFDATFDGALLVAGRVIIRRRDVLVIGQLDVDERLGREQLERLRRLQSLTKQKSRLPVQLVLLLDELLDAFLRRRLRVAVGRESRVIEAHLDLAVGVFEAERVRLKRVLQGASKTHVQG